MVNEYFCPAPWMSAYYHTNGTYVCCANPEKVPGNLDDFKNSKFLKSIKQEFLDGKRPITCGQCWRLEDAGFISVRNSLYNSLVPNSSRFDLNTNCDIEYLDLRTSNLCNFSCRMCGPNDSNQFNGILNEISDENFQNILDNIKTVKFLSLTGGEPMLIKKFYDLLDHIIDNNLNNQIRLQITTNGSVNNPQIVDRLKKFNNLILTLSIDGVESTAEYQRYGTEWSTVKNNIIKYLQILENSDPVFNTTLSAYNVLDISRLADFLLEMYNINNSTSFILRMVTWPTQMSCKFLNADLKDRAIKELEQAITKLSGIKNFELFRQECAVCQTQLKNGTEQDFNQFINFTKAFDQERNQSFEKTFGYKLY